MRALFINENVGGHATVHLNIRAALAGRDDVESVVYDVPPPSFLRKLAAAPIPGLGSLDLDLQPLRLQLAQSAHVRRALRPLVERADVIHAYTHNVALLSTGLLRRRPSVVSIDGTSAQNAFRLPYRKPTRFTPLAVRAARPFERRVYEAATFIVAHSRWAADSLATYGIEPARVRVIPFGVQVPPVAAQPARGRARIVFVGRSLERKGGLRLLRLYRRHFASVSDLDLITQDTVEPSPGVRVIDDVRPGDGRLARLLAAGTVFVFPSEMDLSPNVVLEAMAAGLPVVALRVAAICEQVEHGVTGLLVEPGDDRQLVAAIEALLTDRDRAARMGAAARARVVERFDARDTTAAVVDVLDEARRLHESMTATRRRAGDLELERTFP